MARENTLKIARGFTLDADYVGGGTFAFLAKKGAGKTYLGRVLGEEFWPARVPFVALDPMDAWWGLRSSADGKSEGIPIPIFGGDHGDAPLERTSGKLMADLVVDERMSMILSLKHFGSRAAERQFALDFLERLYRRNSELVHLLIDEADLFAPQKPQPGDAPLLGVTENIVRRGRNSGIGVSLFTQRPAVLNKDVLTQVDGLVAMRIVGLQDREAIDLWVRGHGDVELAAEVKASLSGLETGECWWWVPELGVLKRVKVRRSHTFDSSPTRRRSLAPQEPKSYSDVDMSVIEARMAETIERAKADDPRELRKRISDLERQLGEQRIIDVQQVQIEVPVLTEAEIERLRDLIEEQFGVASQFEKMHDAIRGTAEDLTAAIQRAVGAVPLEQGERREPPRSAPAAQPLPRRPAPVASNGEVQLKAGARRMLAALAWLHPEPLTRVQLGTLANIVPTSGTFSDYIGSLKRAGLAEEWDQKISLTAEGVTVVGDEAHRAPPSPQELKGMWSQKFKAGARRMLDELFDAYPNGLTRDELAERVEIVRTSGTFSDYLGSLKRNKVAVEANGVIRAGDALFLGATR